LFALTAEKNRKIRHINILSKDKKRGLRPSDKNKEKTTAMSVLPTIAIVLLQFFRHSS
jgi:hypothetical protein